MDRRVLAVALLAVLAGCAGALAGSPNDAGDGRPELAEQSWSDGESVQFDALLARHNAVVSDARALERRAVVPSDDHGRTRVSFVANATTERAYLNITASVENGTELQQTFVDGDQLHARAGTPASAEVTSQPFSPAFSRFVRPRKTLTADADVLSQWDFEYAGFEGGAFVFEADSVTPGPGAPDDSLDAANVTETNATLRVSERGVVRELSVRATLERDGETTTVRSVTEYALNGTTVETPDWVAED